MKPLLVFLTVITGFASPLSAKGVAAKDALRTLAREKGASWLERIVQVGGDQGKDQPAAWHIVAQDGNGGLREFFVGARGVISEGGVPAQVVPTLQGSAMVQKKIAFDSTNAFMRAQNSARQSQVGFDSVTYRLRNQGRSASPVWVLQLNNPAGQKVAEVSVSAVTGKVVQTVTYSTPPPPPPVARQPAGQPWERTKEVVNRSTQTVGRGINKAGQWISRKFAPQR